MNGSIPNGNEVRENGELYLLLKNELDKLCLLKDVTNSINGVADNLENNLSVGLVFKSLPSRVDYPDYYKIIKNPMSFDMIYQRLNYSQYDSIFKIQNLVNDIKQISDNAQFFYNPTTIIYKFAVLLETYLQTIFIPILSNKFNLQLYFPDARNMQHNLIPQSQQQPQPKLQPSPIQMSPSTPIQQPQFQAQYLKNNHNHQHRKHIRRGRPPVIDFPYVQRIKNIFKMLKKEIDQAGEPLTLTLEKLPESIEEYRKVISNPITLDEIRKNVRARKYKDFMGFKTDMDLMIQNYQKYNLHTNNKQNLKRYDLLCARFNLYCEIELNKPDKDFIPEGGELRYPLIEVNWGGQPYKIGDWVLLKNPNDVNKPIVGQIFKMWQTQDGKKCLNACWYFRPEQTVHRFDRLFYKNEVVKTGQYRDHDFTSIIGQCYVVHFTRFQRGDPRHLKELNLPLFICEFRYNENDKNFNKIRTWRACVPEEIRDQPEDTIPVPGRKFFKYPSPLAHLLPPTATLDSPMPESTPGLNNGPPIIGAVYLRPILQKDDLGEYATSPDCPRYIIRPNDQIPEGQIDFLNGTITTNESLGNNMSKVGSSSIISDASHSKIVETSTNKNDLANINLNSKVSNKYDNNENLRDKQNLTSHNNLYTTNGVPKGNFTKDVSKNPQKYTSYVPSKTVIMNNKLPLVINKVVQAPNTNKMSKSGNLKQQKYEMERLTPEVQLQNIQNYQIKKSQSIKQEYNLSSIITNFNKKGSKSSLGKIIIDVPNSYLLAVPLNTEYDTLHKADKTNVIRRSIPGNTVRYARHVSDIIWFKGPGINIGDRMLNNGSSVTPQLNTWKKHQPVSFETVEETVHATDDDAVLDSDDERTAEPDDNITDPIVSLKASASYLAYKLRQPK